MFKAVPRKIWIYSAVAMAFAINAGFVMRGSMMQGMGFKSDITIANLELDVKLLTNKKPRAIPTMDVIGDMTSDSPERVYMVDIRVDVYSCPPDAGEGIDDCTLAMDFPVSLNVDLERGETEPLTGFAYPSARDLPIAPELRWTYKAKRVFTR